ncbi:HAMP domain-containing sensor histidine kinase [Paenibacillus sp. MMS20-IR301]|uniref:HAMP domain-containing sensor histidine kinase n=1 Tax=Paenibacillus sp. MMS20-IR301 TaxID=2895946 RepID=UPI0028ED9D6C|nr:HAMP domain-containing sensor histidine kinase [Paenibacillus sp. MMS20-IR301]WNS41353.1 HAMP domain-containing sensor histidine kinase [Paenibacillus sp. MMS20-IR301]
MNRSKELKTRMATRTAKAKKPTSILSYWTLRYLLIISIGLLLTALVTFWWIQQEAMNNRMQTTGLLAQEIADRSVGIDGELTITNSLDRLVEDRKRFFKLTVEMCVIITGPEGELLYSQPPLTDAEMRHKLNDSLTDSRSPEFKAASAEIRGNQGTLGQVIVLQSKRSLRHIPQEEITFFSIIIVFLIILSWLTIYLLSIKLAKPIQRVAAAAAEISSGKYNIVLKTEANEREIHELLVSFQEMAGKLQQFEQSRAVMLAGVSHELKTPVTSIKGLLHAVREGVVDGEEAGEFLDIALLEAERLQRMVADLLDYNALAAGIVAVRHDRLEAAPLLEEILYQWSLTQGEEVCEPVLQLPGKPLILRGDPLRIQQIVVNLLNNSVQARVPGRKLQLTLQLTAPPQGGAVITVTDNGTGISPESRELIFEPFFRSTGKQSLLRGLGLGLTFSRLLAEAMGGSLELGSAPGEGCSFVLRLPLAV